KGRQQDQRRKRNHDIEKPLHEKAYVFKRSRRERQERSAGYTIKCDFTVYMREKVDGHTGAHALFVAMQENLFQACETAAIHIKDHLIDNPAREEVWQTADALCLV